MDGGFFNSAVVILTTSHIHILKKKNTALLENHTRKTFCSEVIFTLLFICFLALLAFYFKFFIQLF